MQATAQMSHSLVVMRQMLIFAAEFSGGGSWVACGLEEGWVMTNAFCKGAEAFRDRQSGSGFCEPLGA